MFLSIDHTPSRIIAIHLSVVKKTSVSAFPALFSVLIEIPRQFLLQQFCHIIAEAF